MATRMAAAPADTDAFCHRAFLYGDRDGFLEGVVGFVREGLETGAPTLLVLARDRLAAVAAEVGIPRGAGELGPMAPTLAADGVLLADMAAVGANPARIIPAWRRFVDAHRAPGRRLRGVGEPVWPGRTPTEIVECQLHEALLNVAFEGEPFDLLCPYDAGALPEDVLVEAGHSHPVVGVGADTSASPHFGLGPWGTGIFDAPLPEPHAPVERRRFGPGDLGAVRGFVRRRTAAAGLGPRADEIALAVHEAAANSVRHGGGDGTCRTWTERGMLVFEITNPGRVCDPLAGRIEPAPDAPGGRGLWLMNQVCDLVQVRNTAGAVVVRLHVTTPG
ncbi:MAG TPA: sensor histidine kinase [Acidimicrobiales bacterium]|nr:sensor histidine kinase [Acidimicrobiales bacterium]